MKLPVVGVMGSGKAAHEELTCPLGDLLATLPVHLLTGGGGGVMQSVSRHFVQSQCTRSGLCLGVVPGIQQGDGTVTPPLGYPNDYVELAIATHLPVSGAAGMSMESRNHINVLSSDVIVALPGSEGTASEVQLARRYGKPVLLFLGSTGKTIEGLALPPTATNASRGAPSFRIATTIDEVKAFLLECLPHLLDGGSKT